MVASVVPFQAEMPRKRSEGTRQVHPQGGLVTLTDDIRKMLKDKRVANGWSQRAMGELLGITGGAISGIETGTTSQIHKSILAKYFRAFGETAAMPKEAPVNTNIVERITEKAIDLRPQDQQMVLELIERLATQR